VRRCSECGARAPEASAPATARAPDPEAFVALAADEPERIGELLERLVAAGIVFDQIADSRAEDVDVLPGSAGHPALVSVRVRRADLERARVVEDEWMRERLPDSGAPIPLEGNAAQGCPACGAPLTAEAAACTACGLEIPTLEGSS